MTVEYHEEGETLSTLTLILSAELPSPGGSLCMKAKHVARYMALVEGIGPYIYAGYV